MPLLHKEYISDSYTVSETDKLIEKYIDENCNCKNYDELICNEESKEVFFQLSSLRSGLLNWYDFNSDAEVLEIGGGFGALTGLLCDKCKNVTVTERSEYRAEAICKRYFDKNNLDVYAGDALDIAFIRKFDYIVLVGILERIGNGSFEQNIYVNYINSIRNLLKPNGKLLLAVDNRYGLRYFCGEVEPHTNKPFDGINRYPNGTNGYSFSKKELDDIITAAGFTKNKFYYPLPDYKVTQLIYTDDYLPDKNISERLIPYYSNSKTLLAYESDLYADIAYNNAFVFFANSFFVECCLTENYSSVIYAAISSDRIKERAFATTIHSDGTVKKSPLYDEGKKSIEALYNNICDISLHGLNVVPHNLKDNSVIMPYVKSSTLSNYLKEIIKTDKQQFLNIIDHLYDCIIASSEHISGENNALLSEDTKHLDWGVILKKAYIELIPLNCFYENGEFVFFDQEFVYENYPAKYVLFRTLLNFYTFTPYAEKNISLQVLKERYGLTSLWDIFLQIDSLFLKKLREHNRFKQFYKLTSIDKNRMQQNAELLGSGSSVISNYIVSEKIKSIWAIQIDLLNKFKEVCDKNNLKFFIINGTLLGAVRHKGFIPWDDDIDVVMPRDDYDKLKKIAQLEFSHPYFYQTPENDHNCFFGGYSRLRNTSTTGISINDIGHDCNHGIWIDIFTLDSMTTSNAQLKEKCIKIKKHQKLLYAKVYGKDCDSFNNMDEEQWDFYRRKARFYSHKHLCKKLNKAIISNKDSKSEFIAIFSFNSKHQPYYKSDFEQSVLLEFAGKQYPAPIGYKRCLEMSMGKDYMTFPPLSQQKPHHLGVFDPYRSYKEYNSFFANIFEDAKAKTIVIFGAGVMVEDYIERYGKDYKPEFLVDNDTSKWGTKRHSITIKNPDELLNIPKEKLHLIICSVYYRQIEEQLNKMGINKYKIYTKEKLSITMDEERGR